MKYAYETYLKELTTILIKIYLGVNYTPVWKLSASRRITVVTE
jgi:hypothetical protein